MPDAASRIFIEEEGCGPNEFIPSYEVYEDKLVIHDTVWGDETIDANHGEEAVLVALAKHPAMQRLMYIEHLTLPDSMSTVPNTSMMSTWETLWGSVVATRRLLRSADQDPSSRESIVLQLRTLVSDLAKTAFAHAGDWRFQGMGGDENKHDHDLMDYVEATGVGDLLQSYDFDPMEVVFPRNKVDFVECPSPMINVDRLDYTLRERRRHPDAIERAIDWSSEVSLIDGEIVFNTVEAGMIFARGNVALGVVNWQEPAHKANLNVLLTMIDYISVHNLPMDFGYPDTLLENYHPNDLMYAVDEEFMEHSKSRHRVLAELKAIADRIGFALREAAESRTHKIEQLVRGEEHDFDEQLPESESNIPGLLEIIDVTNQEPREAIPDFGKKPDTIDFYMPHLKLRKATIPNIMCEDGVIRPLNRLTGIGMQYQELSVSAQKRIGTDHVARIYVDPAVRQLIEDARQTIAQEFPKLLERPHMQPDVFGRVVRNRPNLTPHIKVNLLWAD